MRRAFALLMAALMMTAVGAPALASPGGSELLLNAADEQTVREFFDQYGVPEVTQDQLIATLQQGGTWDALDSSAEPVVTQTTTSGNQSQTVATYADGSILVTDAPAASPQVGQPGIISPMNFGQCVVLSSSPYHVSYGDCFVSASNGISWASFRADYSKYQGGPAEIDDVNSKHYGCIPCSLSDPNLYIVRQTATTTRPAKARFDWTFAVGPWGSPSGTAYLEMHVTAGGTVTTPNDVAPWSS